MRMAESRGHVTLNPTAFRRAAWGRFPHFGDGNQHDAMEFMGMVLDALREEARAAAPRKESWERGSETNDVIQDLVEFVESSTVECQGCGGTSTTCRAATHVILALPRARAVTLEECLVTYFSAETLDGENAYDCPRCPRKSRAEKRLKFGSLPKVMLFGIKRTFYEDGVRELRTALSSPGRIDLGAFSIEPRETGMYDLVAVVNHSGKDGSGHYTVDIRGDIDKAWFHFDDETARPAEGYRAEEAVILVYERNDPEPVPLGTFPRGKRQPPKVWTCMRPPREPGSHLSGAQENRRRKQIREERATPRTTPTRRPWQDEVAADEASTRFALAMEQVRLRQRLSMSVYQRPDSSSRTARWEEVEVDTRLQLEVDEMTERQLVEESAVLGQREHPKLQAGRAQGEVAKMMQQESDARLKVMDDWRQEVARGREMEQEMKVLLATLQNEWCLQQERCKLQKMEEALSKSYYEALGVPHKASATTIRAAYRRLALECHPDKFPHESAKATAVFQALRKAHETLSDPKARSAYDQTLEATRKADAPGQQEEEPQRPEPTGTFGLYPLISLAKRFGLDPEVVRREDAKIRKARAALNLFASPSRQGACWILLPGCRLERAKYLGAVVVTQGERTWQAQVANVEGHSAAVELTPCVRLFSTQWEAMAVRSAILGSWW